MSMRLLPKEPVLLRDTSGQDRVIERASLWTRHRTLLAIVLAARTPVPDILVAADGRAFAFRGADGRYRWFNIRGEPLRASDGESISRAKVGPQAEAS